MLDLATGDVARHPIPGGRSIIAVAWSPDGRRIAYLSSAEATSTTSGTPAGGDVGVLDLRSGTAHALPGATRVWAAAFSPDGSELAVQHTAAAGGALEVVALDGGGRRECPLPAGHHLGGADAWCPDGAVPTGGGNYGVGRFQLTAALLPDLRA